MISLSRGPRHGAIRALCACSISCMYKYSFLVAESEPLLTRFLRNSDVARGLSATVLILALFVNALIPNGWMPSFGDHGAEAKFVICSAGQDGLTALANGESPSRDGGSKNFAHKGDGVCPFTAVLFSGPEQSNASAVELNSAAINLEPQARDAAPKARFSGALGSRAPPILL